MQGKHRTPDKNYYQRKINPEQTSKARKGFKTAQQHNSRPTLPIKQVANGATIVFRFQFLKKNRPIKI